jgi:uncharacterized protein (TIGR02001 family)
MKPVKLCTALAAALLLALPMVSFAQEAAAEEEESPISWSLTATSDYVFRGVSQSDEDPTGQAGITYTAPFGVYAGVWASGVDFGSKKPDFEVDYFVGYNVDFSEQVNFDVMLNRYTYPDAAGGNYLELITKTTFFDNYSATVAYTDDFYGLEEDSFYYALGASYDLPNDYGLSFNVGHTTISEKLGYDDYTDYGITLSKSWGVVSASLGYVGTDSHGEVNFGDWAEDRIVFSLSVGQ